MIGLYGCSLRLSAIYRTSELPCWACHYLEREQRPLPSGDNGSQVFNKFGSFLPRLRSPGFRVRRPHYQRSGKRTVATMSKHSQATDHGLSRSSSPTTQLVWHQGQRIALSRSGTQAMETASKPLKAIAHGLDQWHFPKTPPG